MVFAREFRTKTILLKKQPPTKGWARYLDTIICNDLIFINFQQFPD